MRSAFLPEIFFNFREIVEVVESFHEGQEAGQVLVRSLSRTGAQRRDFFRRAAAAAFLRAGLIAFPDDAEAFEREVFVNGFDVARCAANQAGLAAGGDHFCFCAHHFFHAREDGLEVCVGARDGDVDLDGGDAHYLCHRLTPTLTS